MQPASLRRFFLIDVLLFPNAADGPAKSDEDVQRHSVPSSASVADAYTAYKSQLC